MEKLMLNLGMLRVESFAACAEAREDAAALPDAARTRPQICDPVTAFCADA